MNELKKELAPLLITKAGHELSERAERMVEAMSQNAALMEEHCRPIINCLGNEEAADDLIAWVATRSGYSYGEILSYFYQDWYGTREFDAVRNLFEPAVGEYCTDRGSLAVLGAGACGLLYALAKYFHSSFGVDLSLPGLLTAKHLIEGEAVSIHLERAGWKRISLSPPEPSRGDIRFLVANVMSPPFQDASLSLVATQYLLDIVPNPMWFIEEIHRILKPEGVWINFSKPFRWLEDPVDLGPRTLTELTPLLERLNFCVLQTDLVRFKQLNVDDVYMGGDRFDQEVDFFVAQKAARNTLPTFTEARGRMRSDRNMAWDQIPRVVSCREVAFLHKKCFSAGGVTSSSEISIMNTSLPMKQDHVQLAEALFECIDGKQTLREIWHILRDRGNSINEQDFLDIMCCLNIDHYLLDMGEELSLA
ncbi:MAG: class I SAM-dependent methyltransferase [Gammaproteobacteria bacterium]